MSAMSPVPELVMPELTDINRGFWEATARGELALQRCGGCGALRYPIAEVCPQCLSTSTEWIPVSGRASLFSWIVVHNAYHAGWRDRLPYNVALVELEEGVQMFSNVVLPEGVELSLGMPLQVIFEREGDISIPRFAPR
jgi:uncharacterized OB-fold protein